MGDRTWYYSTCPKCGRKDGVETYDAPSCLQYFEGCQYCDYKVDLSYYEEKQNHLVLISKEEARKRGYLCKVCECPLWFEERVIGVCEDCFKKAEEKNEDRN
jgi:hypothetical protein